MTGHLDDPDLARIVGGFSTSREAGEAVLHVAVCASCHSRLLRRHPEQGRRFLETWLAGFASTKGLGVEEVASRLVEFFSILGEEEIRSIRKAPTLIQALRGLTEAHQHLHVTNSPRYHTLAFMEHSLVEARGQWHSSPEEAVRWASIAVLAGEHAEPVIAKTHGSPVWADAQARAWAYLANGRRIGSDLHAADEALTKSLGFLSQGTGTPEVHAEILSLEGSLRRDQRRFRDAWRAAQMGESLYEGLGHQEAAALTALIGASALAEAGSLDRAIRMLQRSLTRLPEGALGGRTHFYLIQNLAWRLTEADKPEEASSLLPRVRELAIPFDEPLIKVRVDWLEGRIHGQLAATTLAEAAFRNARETFLHLGSPYDAALVSLELAALLLEDGRSREAAELARELVPIFRSRGIHREALAAGMLVARSLSDETATVDFVQRVATYLRRARVDPTYRFPG